MRTNFQAFADIAVNYTSLYPGINYNWWANITDVEIRGRAKLSTFGDLTQKRVAGMAERMLRCALTYYIVYWMAVVRVKHKNVQIHNSRATSYA